MKIKIDDNLKKVASVTGCEPMAYELFSHLLCKRLILENILEDSEANYGLSMIEATGKATAFNVISTLVNYLGTQHISMDVFDAFCNLNVIGDGDCPECGGVLKLVGTQGHEIHDGDYLTPNTYVADKYNYKCRVCGNYITTDKEL